MTTNIRSSADGSKSYIAVGGTDRVTIDAATGAVGIGVTPKATWGSNYLALDFGVEGTGLFINKTTKNALLHANSYADSAAVSKYASDGYAVRAALSKEAGELSLNTYESGSADSVLGSPKTTLLITQGNVLMTTANGGLGYGTGAGGTVTQATSKSTAVTLNKPSGRISTHNAALAAGASVSFILNNSLIGSGDTIVANIYDLGNASPDLYEVNVRVASLACSILLTNKDTVSRSEAVGINFAVIKGATS